MYIIYNLLSNDVKINYFSFCKNPDKEDRGKF